MLSDKYELIGPIAEGGMGCVYLALDKHLERQVVVKVSKEALDNTYRESLILEKEMLQRLSHPALPAVYDFFEEEGRSYLIMEYVDGITLSDYVEQYGKVPEQTAVEWGVELAKVLSFLHGQNPPVVYRDLKPSNIILQSDGKIRLIDFGAATVFSAGFLKEQLAAGTPGYSAPEQLKAGDSPVTSDIYSLGAVLHELVTGILGSKTTGTKRPVREYDRGISAKLEKVIDTCLKEKGEERYQSADRVKDALLLCRQKSGWKRGGELLYKVVVTGLWVMVFFSFFIPLMQGVPENAIPFPFLYRPFTFLSVVVLLQALTGVCRRKKHSLLKVEKSILLTEKKFVGWYLILAVMGVGSVLMLWHAAGAKQVMAAKEVNALWVELRDEENRKLLLQEGAVYQPEKRVRFDIAKDELPRGTLSLRILAIDEEGAVYESRVFLVEGKERAEEDQGEETGD